MAENRQAHKEAPVSPPDQPTTPAVYPGMDHSFTLQTMLEIQRCVGELSSTTKVVEKRIEKLDTDLDKVRGQIKWALGFIAATVVILGLLGSFIAYMIDKFGDTLVNSLMG